MSIAYTGAKNSKLAIQGQEGVQLAVKRQDAPGAMRNRISCHRQEEKKYPLAIWKNLYNVEG
ncbi:hypothetical protein [Chitinophaga sp. MM2321]|uniref:hypothetical protein n=1 Tax=Chitinophaga sp. MM2321 TaxID=3137178 RepID=UPI0032D599F9